MNGQPATIVGVAESNFRGALFPELGDLWIPLIGEARDRLQVSRGTAVTMIGQRKDGTSLSEAQAQLEILWTQLQQARPDLKQRFKVRLVNYSATAGGNSIVATRGNRMLAVFSAVTFLTIVIVCANVTNLLIARAVVRQREWRCGSRSVPRVDGSSAASWQRAWCSRWSPGSLHASSPGGCPEQWCSFSCRTRAGR